jgi:hypothetical protein
MPNNADLMRVAEAGPACGIRLIQAVSADGVIGCNRKKCNVPSAFDCLGNLSLVSCTVAGDASRNDLAALGNKKAECAWLFVVNGQVFLCTKAAYFTTLKWSPFAWAAWAACRSLAWAACRALI